jgi:hypothetical protein
MNYDKFGQAYASEEEVFGMLMQNPNLDIGSILISDPTKYNNAVQSLYAELPRLKMHIPYDVEVDEFDRTNQAHWHMPVEYYDLDIARWLLDQCTTQEQLQRVGHELILYQARDLFPLLQYLKYFVDTMRANNVLWGLGRGSSVSSYVLYLIGVHRVDSIYYDLDIAEFLK